MITKHVIGTVTDTKRRLKSDPRRPAAMVLGQGCLQVVPSGEWLVEEVPHGAVLAVERFGGNVGKQYPESANKNSPASSRP